MTFKRPIWYASRRDVADTLGWVAVVAACALAAMGPFLSP